MVTAISKVVVSALHRCWTLLLRSLSPDIREIAVSPLEKPELRLGLLTRFKLGSTPAVFSTTDIPEEILEALNADRDRFTSGALFGPLESVTYCGGALIAHITERGLVNAEHFLAVYSGSGAQQSGLKSYVPSSTTKNFGRSKVLQENSL